MERSFVAVLPAPTITNAPNGTMTSADGSLSLEGTATPGMTVRVSLGAQELGTATVDAGGIWRFAQDTLPDGTHTVQVVVDDGAGNTSDATSVTLTVNGTVNLYLLLVAR